MITMPPTHKLAYRVDPALLMRKFLGLEPHPWQEQFLRAKRGASLAVLTARQVGKTTAAAVAMAHHAIFYPGSLSVIACLTQSQSAEALRKVRDMLVTASVELAIENKFSLELANGSRVLALPGTPANIRGYTVDGWIVADEAAQLDPDIMAVLHPTRIQRPHARFAMLSTAWSYTDPFWQVWSGNDSSWTRIQATIDVAPDLIAPEVLVRARQQLNEDEFKREFLGIPGGAQVSPFTYNLYQQTTRPIKEPRVWNFFRPHIIAHDVGHTNDRSTAVIGGNSPLMRDLVGLREFHELPQGLSGFARAEAIAKYDRGYDYKTIIIADLTFDPSYADILVERFGERVIGLQITSSGDAIDNFEVRQLSKGRILVYKVSRTLLFDTLRRELESQKIRILSGQDSMRAYEQLMQLQMEFKQGRVIYKCPVGHHDDLAISSAMVVWAALHPHLPTWCWSLETRIPRRSRPAPPVREWT